MVQSQSMTSCGGVIRDYKGHFIRAFLRKLRSCLILEAELWSLLFGMMMLKDAEMPNVIIESDCLEVVHLVNGGSSPGHTFVDLVDEICKLKEKESNMLGDSFAKHGLSISTDNCVFLSLPDFARNSFMEDVSLIDYSIIS
ncbi:putative ribonuclease H protein [Glycine max]|nr:putative ribonuclease H protein [Glycine max]